MNQTLKRLLILCLLALFAASCGKSQVEKVQTPAGMKVQRGRNYKEVIEDFEDKGFKNIRTEEINDLEIGWTVKNEEVEEISVGGDTNYDSGVWVPEDTPVVIRYHSYVLHSAPTESEDAGAGTTE